MESICRFQSRWECALVHERESFRRNESRGEADVHVLRGWLGVPSFSGSTGSILSRFHVHRSASQFFSAMHFSDERGTELEGDCNWGTDPSTNWAERVFCFKPKIGSRTGWLVVYPSSPAPLWVDDVCVEAVDQTAVLAWADGIYKTMPPMTNTILATPGVVPDAALARLKAGQSLMIAVFGDSIAGDL